MTTATLPPLPPLQEKFQDTRTSMAYWNLERSNPIQTALLALLSKQHCFYYGKPGIAKSQLIRTLVAHISDFERADFFKKQLHAFMTDGDLFGGVDMVALDNSVHRKAVEKNTLAICRVAMLDEIFKPGDALLNTMLLALNEREFDNDEVIDLPLWSAYTASNELPEGASLDAIADRLIFWHVIERLKDPSNFVRMLQLEDSPTITPTLTVAEIEQAQAEVLLVKVEHEVDDALLSLRTSLFSEGIEPTDRRWKVLRKVIRAAAWMRGANAATIDDMQYIRFALWRRPEDIPIVDAHVLQLASPLDAEAMKLGEDRIEPLLARVQELLTNPKETALAVRQKKAIEVHVNLGEAMEDLTELGNRVSKKGRRSEKVEELRRGLEDATDRLLTEMFKINDASKAKGGRGATK